MRRATPRAGTDPLLVAGATALWIASACNWPLWRALAALPELGSVRGGLFIAAFGVMVAALTLALLALGAWRWTIKPLAAFFLLSAAIGAHFMGSYGVVIDPTMMTNVVQTDPGEVRDLLNWRFAASLVVLAGVPIAVLMRWPVASPRLRSRVVRNVVTVAGSLGLVVALALATFGDLSATMRNHKSLRYLINPVNSFYALGVLAHDRHAGPALPRAVIGADVRLLARPGDARPPLLLLVVGETARADHFSLNGYERPTNPELAPLGVTSYADVTSCGTNTAASLPCMFSHLGRTAYVARDRESENLLDLAQRAGLAVLWLDNQSGCKGLCDRVPNAWAKDPPPGAAPLPAGLCDADGECLDEALLAGLDQRLAALPAERRARGVLLVLHQMGSHGPAYWKRSPPDKKPFKPECTNNALAQCSHDTLLNAYDNSIAYTDHILAGAVQWLDRQQAAFAPALLYVSDHGESLGENNLYLHGLPYAVAPMTQKHVPMVVWFGANGVSGATNACATKQRSEPVTHDNLFHTAMGLLGLRSAEYRPALDLYAPCRSDRAE